MTLGPRFPLLVVVCLTTVLSVAVFGQGRGQGAPPRSPRELAPIDLTGTWVSVVTEDWQWRMPTPARNDIGPIPLNAEGRRVAAAWDLDADRAAGLLCKAFGAPGLMRNPGRFRIGWTDDRTMQTRTLRFGGGQASSEQTWQGQSVASWSNFAQSEGFGIGAVPRGAPFQPGRGGSLKVITTGLRAGYLRKNGAPYSDRTVMTEYFDRHEAFGTEYLTITTIIEDPVYLAQPYIISTDLEREPDEAKWSPSECAIDPPLGAP